MLDRLETSERQTEADWLWPELNFFVFVLIVRSQFSVNEVQVGRR